MRRTEGFTLAEVLLALGILAIAMLALLSVCSTALRANRKGTHRATAVSLAERELTRAVRLVQTDQPAGTRAAFWDSDYPYPTTAYSKGQEQVGGTTFHYAIYASTVTDAMTGLPIGATQPENRLKQVSAAVWWWTDSGSREGYGQLVVHSSRLVTEQLDAE